MTAWATYSSPLGVLYLVSDEQGLLRVWFQDHTHANEAQALAQATRKDTPPLRQATQWLAAYFHGERPDLHALQLHPHLTAFQTQVQQALQTIPYGDTRSYRDLSRQLQANAPHPKNKARAIGQAVGRNPLLIVRPCHRVVASDGALRGYAGGIGRQRALLTFERTGQWP